LRKGLIMSHEFKQFSFPCGECIVQSMCKEKPTKIEEIYTDKNVPCLALPKWKEDEGTYHKMLIESMANLFKEIMDTVDKTDHPAGTNHKNQVPSGYIFLMLQLSYTLCYMVNSTSWNIGELKHFDRDEINRKLKIAKL
jgi:hypothetical protein